VHVYNRFLLSDYSKNEYLPRVVLLLVLVGGSGGRRCGREGKAKHIENFGGKFIQFRNANDDDGDDDG